MQVLCKRFTLMEKSLIRPFTYNWMVLLDRTPLTLSVILVEMNIGYNSLLHTFFYMFHYLLIYGFREDLIYWR